MEDKLFFCKLCGIDTKRPDKYQAHLDTQKHRSNVAEEEVKKGLLECPQRDGHVEEPNEVPMDVDAGHYEEPNEVPIDAQAEIIDFDDRYIVEDMDDTPLEEAEELADD